MDEITSPREAARVSGYGADTRAGDTFFPGSKRKEWSDLEGWEDEENVRPKPVRPVAVNSPRAHRPGLVPLGELVARERSNAPKNIGI